MVESRVLETLSQRIIRNIRDSRLAKLVKFVTEFSLTANIKLNGRPIGALLTFLILILGVAFSIKLVFKKVIRPLIYPALRHLVYLYVRRQSRLLPTINPGNLA